MSRAESLRAAWEKALERGRHADAAKALADLEALEPDEPLWSHRLGEAHRRLGRAREAEDAFVRAAERYLARGFLPRAVAMAKLVASLNPARTDVLARIAPAEAPRPPVVVPPAPRAPVDPLGGAPLLVRSHTAGAPAAPAPLVLSHRPPSFSAPRPPPSAAPPPPVRAAPLTRAVDARDDEVRFSDAPPSSLHVDIEDLTEAGSSIVILSVDDADEVTPDSTPTGNVEAMLAMEPSVDRLALMAASRLFAGLSREALLALADAAELAEFVPQAIVIAKDEPAYALYAIIEGKAKVVVRGAPVVLLGEGEVFGEACLLDEGRRQADVRAETELMTLRIGKSALDAVAKVHPEVEDVLFDLLARRLVTNLMHVSPLFSAFEPRVRLELAQLFEVRRAEANTILAERGKRSDGLYVLLTGTVRASGDDGEARIARGSTFGQGSLMAGAVSSVTIRCETESVLLRLPAAKFGKLAALYPPALAYLAENATDVPPESERIVD